MYFYFFVQGSKVEELSEILPTDPMQKSKLSSDASFLLDLSRPWRLTIFKFSEGGKKKKKKAFYDVSESIYMFAVICYSFRSDLYQYYYRGICIWQAKSNHDKSRTQTNEDTTVTVRFHLRSKHTNTVSLSSWVTWMASTCRLAAGRTYNKPCSTSPNNVIFILRNHILYFLWEVKIY